MKQSMELEMVRVVEKAAIAAARLMGKGDKHAADHAAVEAMRTEFNALDIHGRVVIGEGERDEAPMLYIGEEVGLKHNGPALDIAVDPLEGTNLAASGANNAITVLAVAERGGLLHAPDIYMNKLIVSPEAKGAVNINNPVEENIAALAKALNRTPDELVVVILDRDRHEDLINQVRAAGARIKLIPDGDVLPAIAAAVRGHNIHAVMGIGGAPEGVITAAALKCLNGYMQAHFVVRDAQDEKRLEKMGITDPLAVLEVDDLAPGEHITCAISGVTNGDVLSGVQFFPGGARVYSLVMSLQEGTVRFIDSVHSLDKKRFYRIFR